MALLGKNDRQRLPASIPVIQRLELGMTCLGLNLAFRPMDDVRVRRAAALSLDRNAIAEASGRVAEPSRGMVPPGIDGGAPRTYAPERSLDEARRLLAEAGHADGRGLGVVDLWANGASPPTRNVAEAIAKNLGQVGIRVQLRTAPWTEFLGVIDGGKAPAYLLTWVVDTPDRDSFLGVLFHSKGANNYLHYGDPEVDSLLDEARHDMDPVARVRLYRAAEDKIEAASVLIPLYSQANTYALQPGLRGFTLNPLGLIDLSRVHWEEPRTTPGGAR
jgi:ABC-type transport system substrate-binding protein